MKTYIFKITFKFYAIFFRILKNMNYILFLKNMIFSEIEILSLLDAIEKRKICNGMVFGNKYLHFV